jgi:phage portal protein BeeE
MESQVFLPEEVWFEKLPNPFDFWRGMSPLEVAGIAARTDFAAGVFMKGLIENNADSGLIVRTNEQVGPEQYEEVRAALRKRKRRAGIADEPLFLSGVNEIVRPALSSSDLQFLENRKFSRAEICAAFGVPEEIVTTTEHSKYDVMAGARLNFIENRIAPLCARLEAEENFTTIPAILAGSGASAQIQNQNSKIENVVGWFDLDSLPLMQEARRNRLASAKTGFELGVPFNELNRVLDLGFKPLPWGDEGYVAANLQRLGSGNQSTVISDQ